MPLQAFQRGCLGKGAASLIKPAASPSNLPLKPHSKPVDAREPAGTPIGTNKQRRAFSSGALNRIPTSGWLTPLIDEWTTGRRSL